MKVNILIFLQLFFLLSFSIRAQDWPASSNFVYFGDPVLNQSSQTNYSLLQSKTTGTTFLNSPDQIYFRINNISKGSLSLNGFIFSDRVVINGLTKLNGGYDTPWPHSPNFSYFGATELNQNVASNYALLQSKTTGTTYLNSPDKVVFRISNYDQMTLNGDGKLGINKPNPIYHLDVNGTINANEILIGGQPISNGNNDVSWPVNSNFSYFGSDDLNQTISENYALLQHNSNGTTYLNSPDQIYFRINNIDKGSLSSEGFRFSDRAVFSEFTVFENGYDTPWPVNSNFSYFGASGLDQSNNINYSLLQNRSTGTTYLNSPDEVVFRIRNVDKMTLSSDGKLGINKPDPLYDLDINGTINANEILIDGQPVSNGVPSLWSHHSQNISYSDGSVAIGVETVPLGYLLAVDGKAIMEEVSVQLSADWPDYVFGKDYQLMSLRELEEFIELNSHLPGIPSASEVEREGLELGEMSGKLLEKIEELTVHTINQEKQIEQQQKVINQLIKRLEKLEK